MRLNIFLPLMSISKSVPFQYINLNSIELHIDYQAVRTGLWNVTQEMPLLRLGSPLAGRAGVRLNSFVSKNQSLTDLTNDFSSDPFYQKESVLIRVFSKTSDRKLLQR